MSHHETQRTFTTRLEFVGDTVCIPGFELYCVVLLPSGHLIMANANKQDAEDCASWIHAALLDYDQLWLNTTVETMTALEYRDLQKKLRRGKRMRAIAG